MHPQLLNSLTGFGICLFISLGSPVGHAMWSNLANRRPTTASSGRMALLRNAQCSIFPRSACKRLVGIRVLPGSKSGEAINSIARARFAMGRVKVPAAVSTSIPQRAMQVSHAPSTSFFFSAMEDSGTETACQALLPALHRLPRPRAKPRPYKSTVVYVLVWGVRLWPVQVCVGRFEGGHKQQQKSSDRPPSWRATASIRKNMER